MNFEDITFRPIQPQDEDFLCEVYTSTRWEEMSTSGWNENQIRAFLKEQFTYQHKYYQENYAYSDSILHRIRGDLSFTNVIYWSVIECLAHAV